MGVVTPDLTRAVVNEFSRRSGSAWPNPHFTFRFRKCILCA